MDSELDTDPSLPEDFEERYQASIDVIQELIDDVRSSDYDPENHPFKRSKKEFIDDILILGEHSGDLEYPQIVGQSYGLLGNLNFGTLLEFYWKLTIPVTDDRLVDED